MRCKLHCGYGRTLSGPGAGLIGIAPPVRPTPPARGRNRTCFLRSRARFARSHKKTLSLVPEPPPRRRGPTQHSPRRALGRCRLLTASRPGFLGVAVRKWEPLRPWRRPARRGPCGAIQEKRKVKEEGRSCPQRRRVSTRPDQHSLVSVQARGITAPGYDQPSRSWEAMYSATCIAIQTCG